MFFILLITTADLALRRKRVLTTQKMFKRLTRRTDLWHTVMYTKCFYSYYYVISTQCVIRAKTIIYINMPLPRNSDDFVPRSEIELLEAAMFHTECLAEYDWRSNPIYHGNQKSSPSVRDTSFLGQPEERAEPDGRDKRIAAVKTVQADRRKCAPRILQRSYSVL